MTVARAYLGLDLDGPNNPAGGTVGITLPSIGHAYDMTVSPKYPNTQKPTPEIILYGAPDSGGATSNGVGYGFSR